MWFLQKNGVWIAISSGLKDMDIACSGLWGTQYWPSEDTKECH